MGHYSTLKIGSQELSWKYDIPSYLSFLFEETDGYREEDPEFDEYQRIGFRTSCKQAINKLDKLGFDWGMITEIYTFFYDQLKTDVYHNIVEELTEKHAGIEEAAFEKKTTAYFNKIPDFSREEELKDFVNFLLPLIAVSTGKKSMTVRSIDGKVYKLAALTDVPLQDSVFNDPGQFFFDKALLLPSWILIIGNLFDYNVLQEYTEIISVVQIKLLLEASDHSEIVELQLEDIIESEEDIADFHIDSANRLIGKIQLYNKFFDSIMNQEQIIKDAYFKEQLQLLLHRIPRVKSSVEKGKALESLTELIFSSVTGLKVIEQRLSTKDQEIDLVIKNSVKGTFWTSLQSPLFFVECKNWRTKVGAPEVRDFETKMRNHKKLVKIGFFIAYNGFTREVESALKRASREEYHMVLIDKNDLLELATSKKTTIEWMEKLISKLH